MNTNFVHPNETKKYEELNLIYKLVGRSFETPKLLKTFLAYTRGKYSGDLRNIVENFKHSQKPVYYGKEQKTSFLTIPLKREIDQ